MRLSEQTIDNHFTCEYIERLERLKKRNKILFLDHQGVMYTKKHPNPGVLDNFDSENIKVLNKILEKDKDIEIVVSSDWKTWVSPSEMNDFYIKQNKLLLYTIYFYYVVYTLLYYVILYNNIFLF